MSDDDLSTVSYKKDKVAKEFEMLRTRYESHRQTLERLITDSPTEALAGRYADVLMEIDSAILKLQELEKGTASTSGAAAGASLPGVPLPGTKTAPPPPPASSAGSKPLYRSGTLTPSSVRGPLNPDRPRLLTIIVVGIAVLAILGWLAWAFLTRQREGDQPITATPDTAAEAAEQVPAEPAPMLQIEPASTDYGVVRKGTRVAKSFTVQNLGDTPLTLDIPRSQCRCLWFDHDGPVPPNGTLQLGVIVDGARAKAGRLEETVTIRAKEQPDLNADLTVLADVR